MGERRIPQAEAIGMTVGEVMIAKPKTLPGDAVVADVRRAFENPSVRTVLLADDGMVRGAVERDLLPGDAAADEPASRYVESDPVTTTPGVPIAEAIELLDARPEPRLIVLDDDGATLRGLVCFNRSSSGFCVK
ncbi:MAG: CBS domain-containing protein [Solirubrobacteraceae bacterium]